MITIRAQVLTPATVSCAEGRISAEKRAAKLERAARLAKLEKVVKRARAAKEGPVYLAVALPTREQAAMKPVVKAVSAEMTPIAAMSPTI